MLTIPENSLFVFHAETKASKKPASRALGAINDLVTFLSLRTGALRLRGRVHNTPEGEVWIRCRYVLVKRACRSATAAPSITISRCAVSKSRFRPAITVSITSLLIHRGDTCFRTAPILRHVSGDYSPEATWQLGKRIFKKHCDGNE
jgi:hypothetical protein